MRTFVVFPTLLLLVAYLIFRYRKQRGRGREAQGGQKNRQTWKPTFGQLAAIALMCAGLAWTSVSFPACMAYIFSREPYLKSHKVVGIAQRSGGGFRTIFDMELRDQITGRKVTLRLGRDRYEKFNWKTGDELCVWGRTSVFGTVSEIESNGRCVDGVSDPDTNKWH